MEHRHRKWYTKPASGQLLIRMWEKAYFGCRDNENVKWYVCVMISFKFIVCRAFHGTNFVEHFRWRLRCNKISMRTYFISVLSDWVPYRASSSTPYLQCKIFYDKFLNSNSKCPTRFSISYTIHRFSSSSSFSVSCSREQILIDIIKVEHDDGRRAEHAWSQASGGLLW